MSVRQELAAELLADGRFQRLYADLSGALGAELLAAVFGQGPRSSVAIRPADEEQIRHRVEIGNRLLAGEFQLELAGYGYLLANGHEPIRSRLPPVEQEFSLERDADPLHGTPPGEAVPQVHRSAESWPCARNWLSSQVNWRRWAAHRCGTPSSVSRARGVFFRAPPRWCSSQLGGLE